MIIVLGNSGESPSPDPKIETFVARALDRGLSARIKQGSPSFSELLTMLSEHMPKLEEIVGDAENPIDMVQLPKQADVELGAVMSSWTFAGKQFNPSVERQIRRWYANPGDAATVASTKGRIRDAVMELFAGLKEYESLQGAADSETLPRLPGLMAQFLTRESENVRADNLIDIIAETAKKLPGQGMDKKSK